MEEETRDILCRTIADTSPPKGPTRVIRARLAAICKVELKLPEHGPMRSPRKFG